MKKCLRCILLVDDNVGDNYLHSIEILKVNPDIVIIEKTMALDALNYLEKNKNSDFLPELIFLDLYMPCIGGWEFLEKFSKFDINLKDRIIVILSGSENPYDKIKAESYCQSCVCEFKTKPLTENMLREIMEKYFISDLIPSN